MVSGDGGDDTTDDENGDGDIIENGDKIMTVTKTMLEDDEQHS